MSICMYVSAVPGHDLLQYMQLFIDSFIVIILADYTVHIRTYICNIVFPKQRATVLILTGIGSWLMVRYCFCVSLFSCPLLVLVLVCDCTWTVPSCLAAHFIGTNCSAIVTCVSPDVCVFSYCIYTLKYVMAFSMGYSQSSACSPHT